MTGIRILVTGGSGMVGSNLIPRLVSEGALVYAFARPSTQFSNLDLGKDQVMVMEGDITDRASLDVAVNQVRPEIMFHLASTPFNQVNLNSQRHMDVNAIGTLNLLESAKQISGVKVIFTGSIAAYGGGSNLHEDLPMLPSTLLGASKACASILIGTYARLYNLNTVELRLFSPYGPWENPTRFIPHVITSALLGNDISMTSGVQERDYVYIGDVIDALVTSAMVAIPSGSVLNIGSGVGTPIRCMAKQILKIMGNPVNLSLGSVTTRDDEIMEMSADITAAKNTLNWEPKTTLPDGVKKSIDWFRGHPDFYKVR